MKRILTILAILLLPLSVWAMTPIADSDLSNVTGQAGVNISLDLSMNINIGTMAWGDADGIAPNPFNPWTEGGSTSGGFVGVNNFNINNLWIRGRVETWDNFNSYSILLLKPLTIDVATGPKAGVSNVSGSVTFVRIGIGALEISMDAMSLEVALGAKASTSNGTDGFTALNQIMGTFNLGALDVYINPWSYVDIYAHNGVGVNFDVNMTIDRITMGYASWGDSDGISNFPAGVYTAPYSTDRINKETDTANWKFWMAPGTAANRGGYVGLRDFNLGDATHAAVTMNGTVAIDVNTSSAGTYCSLAALGKYLQSLPALLPGPVALGNLSNPNAALPAAAMTALGMDPNQFSGSEAAALATIGGYTGTAADATPGRAYLAAYGWTAGIGNANVILHAFLAACADAPNVANMFNPTYAFGYKPISVVHISFPTNFNVMINKITANVAVGATKQLYKSTESAGSYPFNNADIYGDIYLSGLNLTVKQGSWVDIWAH